MKEVWPILLIGCLLAVLVACGAGGTAAPPNVILMIMDTTRADRCSVNGYERPTTPALEALAREGMNFRNTWSPAGWAGPAHASIFTGLLPVRHGLRRGNRYYLDDGATTLAEHLRGAGYRTACLTNNPIVSPEFGLAQGFDDYFPLHLNPHRDYPTAPATHRTALDWITRAEQRGEPFFLFINNMEPHSPYTPPKSFRKKFRNPSIDPAAVERAEALGAVDLGEHNLGLARLSESDIAVLSDLYDAEIACLDHAIGQFIAELRQNGILQDTLLIVTSDHGENLGEHGLVEHMFSLHRTVRHVPLIIRLPDGKRAGEVIDEVARLEDIFPTVLEVCGVPVPQDLDGESLLGDLGDRQACATMGAPHRFLSRIARTADEEFDPQPWRLDFRAVFDGRFHRIWSSDGRVEVYDILADPEESRPLSEGASGIPADPSPRRKTPGSEPRSR